MTYRIIYGHSRDSLINEQAATDRAHAVSLFREIQWNYWAALEGPEGVEMDNMRDGPVWPIGGSDDRAKEIRGVGKRPS